MVPDPFASSAGAIEVQEIPENTTYLAVIDQILGEQDVAAAAIGRRCKRRHSDIPIIPGLSVTPSPKALSGRGDRIERVDAFVIAYEGTLPEKVESLQAFHGSSRSTGLTVARRLYGNSFIDPVRYLMYDSTILEKYFRIDSAGEVIQARDGPLYIGLDALTRIIRVPRPEPLEAGVQEAGARGR